MTLALRLLSLGFFLGLLVVGSSWLPPFPSEFGSWLNVFFTKILLLDTWLPVRLTISLLVVRMGVELAVYLFSLGKWFKNFVLGDGRA